MINDFVNSLAQNSAVVIAWVGGIGAVVGLILFIRARARRIQRMRAELSSAIPMSDALKQALGEIFNVHSAELTTVGAVTFADIAWQYSMADPTIWDHFDGPAADHMADAIQNLDVLRASLGAQSGMFFENVIDGLKHVEALHVFNDLADKLPMLESAGTATAVAVEASSHSLVDTFRSAGATLTQAKADAVTGAATAAGDTGLIGHLPLVTIGFATYRAWRRSQKGTQLKRNLEFTGIEVATRAGGGLAGGQLGGLIGTAIAPGVGTIVGGVIGAIGGTLGGMLLGEDIKKRHVKKAQETFDASLETFGKTYLKDPVRYKQLTSVFMENEREYTDNLKATRQRLLRYSMSWRVVWPDQKLVLLQETVRLAEDRLGSIKQGTVDAIDRLNYMRETDQHHELGILLWSNPALRDQLHPDAELVQTLELSQDKLRHELIQLQGAAA